MMIARKPVRKPLWMSDPDPVRAKRVIAKELPFFGAGGGAQGGGEIPKIKRYYAVVAIPESNLQLTEVRFGTAELAARFFGVSKSAVRNSIYRGGRCAGRLFWHADRPLLERRPEPPKSRGRPIIVGRVFYPSTRAAAIALGTTVRRIHSAIRSGNLDGKAIKWIEPRGSF